MDILEQILNLSNVVFCLVVVILVFIQNKVVSMYFKKAASSRVYKEILLPLGPIGTGGIMAALMETYTWPTEFQAFWPRICFGMALGLLSAHLYKIVKGFITKKKESVGVATDDKEDLLK
jgi:hypothetical protein